MQIKPSNKLRKNKRKKGRKTFKKTYIRNFTKQRKESKSQYFSGIDY